MSTPSKELVRDLTAHVDPWSAAPFDAPTVQALQRVVQPLNVQQRLWLSGYLAGSLSATGAAISSAAASVPASEPIVTVLYGSQSGNCERLAAQAGEALSKRGVPHVVIDMLDCRKSHLQDARNLLVVVSTHGEGDPPDRAAALHELLHSRKAPPLKHLKYSVLALGDSSYERFCETGRQFDARLLALGAEQLHDRVDCDVDYEQNAREWIDAVVTRIASEHATLPSQQHTVFEPTLAPVATAYTRKNPFLAPVLANQRLTTRDSQKDVRHIELSLEGSGIHYEPGDALGVVVRNAVERVDALLAVLPYPAEAPISYEGSLRPLREVLQGCDIGPVTRTFADKYLERIGQPDRIASIDIAANLQLADFLREHAPRDLGAEDLVRLLRPLAPRLYSIASSARATPDEVHLTVGLVQFELNGIKHFGVASKQFAEMEGDDAVAPVYLHRNPNFRLPADPSSPIIMIGPGTGVAPFRGFIAEREALGARGKNWLFFGEQHFRTDFLYQAEWLDYRKRGALHRIELAFSRDQAGKIYVQHRMREHGCELYGWLQEGAHVYVCGDAQRMAADVQNALLQILQEHGGHSAARAAEELLELQRARRYQRDVY
jgi:sulfite reductase (NADPH) flavoprotein alpha-component